MALAKMSWDELNQLVGWKISEPFEDYYNPMQISEKQKKKRIEMAKAIEEVMINLLIQMFYGEQYDTPVFDIAYSEAVRAYLTALLILDIEPDEYLADHAEGIIANVLDVLLRHEDDPWFYSKDRARAIAEEQANQIYAYTEYEEAAKNKRYKTWHTIMDGRERDSHAEVNNLTLPIDEPFELQGGSVQFPGDDSLGVDASELSNCRCSLSFS